MMGYRDAVIHRAEASVVHALESDAALMASPDILDVGPGLVGLRGDLHRLGRFFEDAFLELARDHGAEEHHYPVLLPVAVLEELGYFAHFPDQVTFCTHLPEDLPLLEAIAKGAKAGGLDAGLREAGELGRPDTLEAALVRPEAVLKPAVCLPCYRQLRGVTVAPGEVQALTMQNHVFRRETAGYRALGRLWDFRVRDLVLVGAHAELHAARDRVMQWCIDLCRQLDLSARIELATDPFFLDQSRDKQIYQRLGQVKFEANLDIPHRDTVVAAASFNLHRDFYAGVYDIRQADGALAETACMGFGIERWIYAFVSQKGLDPSRWPEPARAAVQGDRP